MPRPVTNKRAPTMVAGPSRTSLADALDMNRPNLQEAAREQQAHTCTAAATPSHDTESEGGLSEDESHSVLRRDILHDRHAAFQSVVAPVSCATAANNNSSAASDDDDDESIPTRPTSVVDHSAPSVPSAAAQNVAAPELSESTSTAKRGGYTEDDWDRPLVNVQQQHHYRDAAAQAEDFQNDYYQYQEGSANYQPAFDENDRQDTEPYMARNKSGDSQQYLQYLTQYGDEESRRFAEESALEQPQQNHQHVHHHHHHSNNHHHHHEIKYAEEEEIYNPDCNCDECIEMFVNQQRRDINRRWGHLFPNLYAEHAPRAATHHTHVSSQPQSHQKRVMPSPRTLQRNQEQAATKKQLYDAEGKPMHPRGSRGGNPFALVACCYFKQKGYCKMGNDCWYSHDADESTPCHYGALCKATGHKELVKSTSSNSAPNDSSYPALAPVPQPVSQQPRMPGQAAPFVAHPTMPTMSTVVPRARPTVPATRSMAAPRPAALLVPSVAPCAYCGAGPQHVMTQEFPVYQGVNRTVGQRAHCTQCLRTYSL